MNGWLESLYKGRQEWYGVVLLVRDMDDVVLLDG